jgi:hypothetical protein
VTGFVAVVYAAATAGGEIARGGLALALLAGGDQKSAVLDRLAAHAGPERPSVPRERSPPPP